MTQGDSVAVIIPLSNGAVLPEGAVYRKYNTVQGWFSFVEDDRNSLSSAFTDASGNCPAANDPVYSPSLTAGDNCMQLRIEDGGPNDTDFTVNGSVEDPGAIVVENLPPVVVTNLSVTVNEATAVTLDASNSSDAEGSALSFDWVQTQGTRVVLSNTTAPTLQFVSPLVSVDETVTDGMLSATSATTITVSNNVEPTPVKSSGGGSMAYLLCLLLALVTVRRGKLFR